MKFKPTQPWAFLDEFRGKEFNGQWPNIKEMFHISCLRYPDNLCFRAFSPKEEKFTYREAEKKIREYLVDYNFIETIIALPPNLFYGTSIAVNILVLSKHKTDTKIQFIDASGNDFFTKETNNNVLKNRHIDKIIDIFDRKEDVDYTAKSIDKDLIAENDYNLSVSSYIEQEDTRPKTDIKELNERIRRIVARENELRAEIDKIVAELEGDEA